MGININAILWIPPEQMDAGSRADAMRYQGNYYEIVRDVMTLKVVQSLMGRLREFPEKS